MVFLCPDNNSFLLQIVSSYPVYVYGEKKGRSDVSVFSETDFQTTHIFWSTFTFTVHDTANAEIFTGFGNITWLFKGSLHCWFIIQLFQVGEFVTISLFCFPAFTILLLCSSFLLLSWGFFWFVFCFWDRISLCCPGWSAVVQSWLAAISVS